MIDKILEKASELFMRNGFKVVTMDDIAEMGISKKTIYQHYENKSVLVECSAKHITEGIVKEIDKIYSELKDPIEEFLLVRDKVGRFITDDKTAGVQQLKKYYPEIHDKLKGRQESKFTSCIQNNLKRGIELELYRADIDVDFITKIHHNAMSFLLDNDEFHTNANTFIQYQNKYIDYHIRAISTSKGIELLNKLKLKHSIHEK